MLQALKVAGSAAISLIFLFLLTRLMGKRQISQLGVFDYINGITLGSIAADLAITGFENFWGCFAAMAVYGLLTTLIALLTDKSMKMRRFLSGKPVTLFSGGRFDIKSLADSRLDINEFLSAARKAGYFDLSEIDSALLEPNGGISFLPTSKARPYTAGDAGIETENSGIPIEAVIDGRVMHENLRRAGVDERWLSAQLEKQGCKELRKIALAVLDRQKNLRVFGK